MNDSALGIGLCCFLSSLVFFPLQQQWRNAATKDDSSLPRISFRGLHHTAILVSDLERAKIFYGVVLGCPALSHVREAQKVAFPGEFFALGRHQIHLMALQHSDEYHSQLTRSKPLIDYAGRDTHTAVSVTSIDPVRQRFDAHRIPYKLSQSGRRALFCRDYDGNGLEFTEDAQGFE